mmetsp:Transcript_1319/g.1858  ORF Transcript_1319/g.1858 Transcript_1319/m.1858 type:complete len:89 (+) Transcript_1319:717-983(+)
MKEPIRKGEELLVTYGRGFWKARGLLAELSSKYEFKQRGTTENPNQNTHTKQNSHAKTKQRSKNSDQQNSNKLRKSESRKNNKKKKKR